MAIVLSVYNYTPEMLDYGLFNLNTAFLPAPVSDRQKHLPCAE